VKRPRDGHMRGSGGPWPRSCQATIPSPWRSECSIAVSRCAPPRPAGDFAVDKILVGTAMSRRKAAATIRPVIEGRLARRAETPPRLGHIKHVRAEGRFRPAGTARRLIAPEGNRHVAPVAERSGPGREPRVTTKHAPPGEAKRTSESTLGSKAPLPQVFRTTTFCDGGRRRDVGTPQARATATRTAPRA
jgi:hypothetical protein